MDIITLLSSRAVALFLFFFFVLLAVGKELAPPTGCRGSLLGTCLTFGPLAKQVLADQDGVPEGVPYQAMFLTKPS